MGIAEKLADEKKPANSDYLSNALASQDIDLEVKGLGLWERHAELLQSAERIGIAPWYYWKIERLSLLESKNDVFSDGHNPCDAIREGLSYTLKGDAENAAALFKKAIDSGILIGKKLARRSSRIIARYHAF